MPTKHLLLFSTALLAVLLTGCQAQPATHRIPDPPTFSNEASFSLQGSGNTWTMAEFDLTESTKYQIAIQRNATWEGAHASFAVQGLLDGTHGPILDHHFLSAEAVNSCDGSHRDVPAWDCWADDLETSGSLKVGSELKPGHYALGAFFFGADAAQANVTLRTDVPVTFQNASSGRTSLVYLNFTSGPAGAEGSVGLDATEPFLAMVQLIGTWTNISFQATGPLGGLSFERRLAPHSLEQWFVDGSHNETYGARFAGASGHHDFSLAAPAGQAGTALVGIAFGPSIVDPDGQFKRLGPRDGCPSAC